MGEGWMTTVKSYLPHLGIASVLSAVTYWCFPESSYGNSSSDFSTASKCGIAAGLAGVAAIGGTVAYRELTKKEKSHSSVDESIDTVKTVFVGSKKRETKTKLQEDSLSDNEIFLIGGAICLVGLLVVVFFLNGSEDSTEVDDCPA